MNKTFKKIYYSLILAIIMSSFIYTVDVSSKEKFNYIEDAYEYFTIEEKISIENEIKKLPETYKIIVLPTINDSVEKMGNAFFEYQELSQDTILILVLMDDKNIHIFTGEALEKKGIDDVFFNQEIEKHFTPNVKNKAVSQALIDLIHGISMDIPRHIVMDKDSPKIPEQPMSPMIIDENQSLLQSNYIYLVIVIVIIILGFIFSRGLYRKK